MKGGIIFFFAVMIAIWLSAVWPFCLSQSYPRFLICGPFRKVGLLHQSLARRDDFHRAFSRYSLFVWGRIILSAVIVIMVVWLLASGFWLLATGYWLLVTWLLQKWLWGLW